MNGKEIIQQLSQGSIPPRVPFCPTIYEHAAKIIGVKPSKMAISADLITAGQIAAYELYHQDIVTVGVDIYNIEAEALGCPVLYYDDDTLPSIDGIYIDDATDLKNLALPNPLKDGRMPVILEACERISEKIGREVPVNGCIVGPFTLAAMMRGYENMIIDFMDDMDFAMQQLRFASQVGLAYAAAMIKKGIGVVLNESGVTPPMLSPELFKNMVFGFEKDLINNIKSHGLDRVALVIGGNTTPIADLLVQTGSSMLMADANTDQRAYKKLCEQWQVNLRASIDPKIVEIGDDAQMTAAVRKVIDHCAGNGRFIFGCGIVSYHTDPENVIKLKTILDKYNPYNIINKI